MRRRRRRDARALTAAGPAQRSAGWHLAVIVVATFLVYTNAFGNAFLWDDIHLIVDNPAIKSWERFPSLWVSDLFPQGVRSYYYRPVQAVTYLVDYQIWGLSPLGYHLTSTLVHGVVALLLYHLASLVLAVPAAALITALLFTIHPIHTEAVTYLSGRSDPLSALFALASLIWGEDTSVREPRS